MVLFEVRLLGTICVAAGVMSDLLYGLKATDLATVAIAAAILISMAVVAGFLTARRASRVDPMRASSGKIDHGESA